MNDFWDGTTDPYRWTILQRIRELWAYRAWYRTHTGWIISQREDDMAELRVLIGLARRAKAMEAVQRDIKERRGWAVPA